MNDSQYHQLVDDVFLQLEDALDACEVDMILVGDSLGNVVLGFENTLPVSMDDMVRHTQAVVRGRARAFVVADMPFMSYQTSCEDALRNAGRLIKETGAEAVKVEGGVNAASVIRAIAQADIPVMAHIGLTPQSINTLGGYKVQGRDAQAEAVLADARAVAEAGAFSVVLEKVPQSLADRITAEVPIPTIGIGASAGCDGQILVVDDMLGFFTAFKPKFVKRYAELGPLAETAIAEYAAEVRARTFPAAEHVFADHAPDRGSSK